MIYNPITVMGLSAMFTLAPHCRNGSVVSLFQLQLQKDNRTIGDVEAITKIVPNLI